MRKKVKTFWSEVPSAPAYNPVQDAIRQTQDMKMSAVLQLFAGIPPSTAVFANPVRYRHTVRCGDEPVDLTIRSFALRGCLFEEDIVTGSADPERVIFVGLFGRFPRRDEAKTLSRHLTAMLVSAGNRVLVSLAKFMFEFPGATPSVAMMHNAAIRKAKGSKSGVRSRAPEDLIHELLNVHIENSLVGAASSYMRRLLSDRRISTAAGLARQTRRFLEHLMSQDVFDTIFSLVLRRPPNSTEVTILRILSAIQIHHGSAGSNMVARYLSSLHTKDIGDIFSAAQMALDGARHFGAITDLTEFVDVLEAAVPRHRDDLIQQRTLAGSLPTFGHPEIAAASRVNQIEVDPRPAIYLAPLFSALDDGRLSLSPAQKQRVEIVQRMYQLAFVDGVEKPGHSARLRIAPNTDFGAWIVQECLGVDPLDRTLISYVFRGFGWMMDVREQLQQPIIRPIIPPEPGIVPPFATDGVVSEVVAKVHDRLSKTNAFQC